MTVMAQIRSCSFNCRGWNNGITTLKNFIDSLDLCFIQEHWLLNDHLHRINALSSDFLSVSVSGMDSSVLVCGRPFGGCSILYRKSLASCIVPLVSCSNRFCAVKFCADVSMLLICVYMPSSSCSSLFNEYLNTLGELDGFIHSHPCDVVIIVGDFNIDFDRRNHVTSLLCDFMSDHDVVSCDLCFRDDVMFTYEHDDGHSRSWIDHVLCSQSFSSIISNVRAIHSGSVLSDHSPLLFSIKADFTPVTISDPVPTTNQCRVNWTRVTQSHIDKYCSMVSQRITSLPSEVVDSSLSDCSAHHAVLDSYGTHVSTLLSCAHECFPTRSTSSRRRLVGWNQSISRLKESSVFWYKIWVEAGCPSSGVLSQIKNSKRRYKYEVRRLIRKQNNLLQKKLATSFVRKKKSSFWSDIKKLNSSSPSLPPVIDGVSGSRNIADIFASKLEDTLNSHSPSPRFSLQSYIQSSITSLDISHVSFSEDDVLEALSNLKSGKSDGDGVFAEHLIFASSPLITPLADYFSSLVRHGFMPHCFRDCVLIPVPKKNKDLTCSSSYRPIALASSLSKTLEHLILIKYSTFLHTSPLQFGFKPGSSTTLCTGVVKNIISRYIHSGSSVHGCFLDASKAFDLVDHSLLFQKLIDRGLPLPVVRFLSSWYKLSNDESWLG